MSDIHSSKIYCEKCDMIFTSQSEYYKHLPESRACESCPIDSMMSKIVGTLRKFLYAKP